MTSVIVYLIGGGSHVFTEASGGDVDRWSCVKCIDHTEDGRRYVIPFTSVKSILVDP